MKKNSLKFTLLAPANFDRILTFYDFLSILKLLNIKEANHDFERNKNSEKLDGFIRR